MLIEYRDRCSMHVIGPHATAEAHGPCSNVTEVERPIKQTLKRDLGK